MLKRLGALLDRLALVLEPGDSVRIELHPLGRQPGGRRVQITPEKYRIEHGVVFAAVSLSLPAARLRSGRLVARPQLPELLGDTPLEPPPGRFIVAPLLQRVRQIAFPRRIRVGLVVCIAIAFAVPERFEHPGGGVSKMLRNLQRAVLARIAHRRTERGVDCIALWRAGHVHRGVRQRELSLRAPEPFPGPPTHRARA